MVIEETVEQEASTAARKIVREFFYVLKPCTVEFRELIHTLLELAWYEGSLAQRRFQKRLRRYPPQPVYSKRIRNRRTASARGRVRGRAR